MIDLCIFPVFFRSGRIISFFHFPSRYDGFVCDHGFKLIFPYILLLNCGILSRKQFFLTILCVTQIIIQ